MGTTSATKTEEDVFFVSNLNADTQEIERVEFNGEEHIKVPAVGLKETVLNYGNRQHLIEKEELEKSVPGWNGRPIVAPDHPTRNNAPITANLPRVLEEKKVGRIFDARVENDKLLFNLYFNVADLNSHSRGEEILVILENGDVGELSTAYTAPKTESKTGKYNGQRFNAVQKDLKPDHVAILLDERGNCSVEDGCGFPRTNSEIYQNTACLNCEGKCNCFSAVTLQNARSTARMPEFDSSETSDWSDVSKTLTAYVNAYRRFVPEANIGEEVNQVTDLPQEAKSWIASKTLLGEANAETVSELLVLPVVNPETNDVNRNALIAAKASASGARGATFSQQQEGSVNSMADRLLRQEFGEEQVNNSSFMELMKDFWNYINGDSEEIQNAFHGKLAELMRSEIRDQARTLVEAEKFEDAKSARNSILSEIARKSRSDLVEVINLMKGNLSPDSPEEIQEIIAAFVSEIPSVSAQDINGLMVSEGVDFDIQEMEEQDLMDNSNESNSEEQDMTEQNDEQTAETEAEASDQVEDQTSEEEEQEYVQVPKDEWESVQDTVSTLEQEVEKQNKAFEEYQNKQQKRRGQLVKTITANSERFTQDMLEDKDMEFLENMADELSPSVYAGQGGSIQNIDQSEQKGTVDSPSVLTNDSDEEDK